MKGIYQFSFLPRLRTNPFDYLIQSMSIPVIINPHLKGDSFYWQGESTGVLLSHGYTATTAEVRPLAQILHQNGFTISGPLLPGHFTQPQDLNHIRWQDWANEVEKAYQLLKSNCQTIFVGGESTGALLAFYLARYHPEVAGILAYSPALKLNQNPLRIFQLYLYSLFLPYIRKKDPGSNQLWQGYGVYPLRGAIQLLRLQKEILRLLPDIHQPVLIFQGKLDETVHPSVPSIIDREIGSKFKEIHWMEKSGHLVILEEELSWIANTSCDFIRKISETEQVMMHPK
jgi:carboxylesterase